MTINGHTNGRNGSNGSNGTKSTSNLDFTTFSNIINGKPSQTTETRHSINPSTLEENPEVPVSTKQDVDDAVDAARTAAELWGDVPVADRQKAVLAYADALDAVKDDFAKMLTKEQGKPVSITPELLAGNICSHTCSPSLRRPSWIVAFDGFVS